MKVGELREKLAKLKKEEIIKLAAEFYKLVPKAKKEDYALDDLINNPTKKKTNKKTDFSLGTIEQEVHQFIQYAKEQYYLYPNRNVPKKERSTWRFKVKRWYKELINTKRKDVNIAKQAKILTDLYELLCESCGYQYFSAYDTFESIGIEQTNFYQSVITLIQATDGKGDSIEKNIQLIMNNHLNRYTLYSSLMEVLIHTLELPILKEKGIEIVNKLLIKNGYQPTTNKKTNRWSFSREEYHKEEMNNNLAELGYRFYCNLFEWQEAINFYEAHYYNKNDEIKLYVLIRLLFENQKKDLIRLAIEQRIEKGIKPRKSLLEILNQIKNEDTLPKYM